MILSHFISVIVSSVDIAVFPIVFILKIQIPYIFGNTIFDHFFYLF